MDLFHKLRGKRAVGPDATMAYAVSDLNQIAEANRVLRNRIGGRVLGDGFLAHRGSDTLFILGSGPSINELDRDAFDEISQADSIGFNYWFAHDFVPNLFMFQLPPHASDPMIQLARLRRADYSGVPFIFRGSRLLENVDVISEAAGTVFDTEAIWLLNEFPIHSRCEINAEALIRFVSNLGLFNHGQIPPFVVKWRGTLGLLLSLGWNMGYKRIVLCGIDMTQGTGGSHFYDSPQYDALRAKVDLPNPGASAIGAMMDKSYGKNTVAVYVAALAAYMKAEAGVEIMVATRKSALFPLLPLWQPSARD